MSAENVEQTTLLENEAMETDGTLDQDGEFKEAVYAKMRQIHTEGMIVGFQTACHTALNKIYAFERVAGSKSTNDYKRCLKDLKKFFEIGVSRKVNSNEEEKQEETVEVETTQN